jgi:hypothetical protein
LSKGQIELYTEDKFFLLGSWGNYGHDYLVINDSPWIDIFEGEQSEENLIYLEELGNFERIDCSEWEQYRDFVGIKIESIGVLRSSFDDIGGVRLSTSSASLFFYVDGDEEYLGWELPLNFYEQP